MVQAGIATFLLVSSALAYGSFAVTLHGEKVKERVVRREPEPERQSVQLSSKGEMASAGKSLLNLEDQLAAEFCDTDYPVGEDAAKNCKLGQSLIDDEKVCIEAAKEAGAKTVNNNFKFEKVLESPKGCFKENCREKNPGMKGICYYYNGLGDNPQPGNLTKGQSPVCTRPKHLNATIHGNVQRGVATNGSNAAVCPKGYSLIVHEDTCYTAAACLGYAVWDGRNLAYRSDSPANKSWTDIFAKGCIINSDDKMLDGAGVYFNPKGDNGKGIQICNVSTITNWRVPGTSTGAVAGGDDTGGDDTAAAGA